MGIESRIRYWIATLDAAIARQVAEIVNHTSFLELFSTWTAIRYLVDCVKEQSIKIKILDARWSEVQHLANSGSGVDNPFSFKILNEQEAFGAEPLSLLLVDKVLDASNRSTVEALDQIAQTCAYAFLPFLAGSSSKIFDCQDWTNIDYLSLEEIHRTSQFLQLASLAKQNYSAFIGLVLPKVRYPSVLKKRVNFLSIEVPMPDGVEASGVFAVAGVIIRSFAETGWFLETLGMPISSNGELLPVGAVPQINKTKTSALQSLSCACNVPFMILENKERELSKIGFIPLCQGKQNGLLLLCQANMLRSLWAVKEEKEEICQLPYLLCVCRFAHYIRTMGRTKVGQFTHLHDLENYLNQWLTNYIASNPNADRELKRRYPLLGGKVVLSKSPFSQTKYNCSVHLQPHLLSAGMSIGMTLQANLAHSSA